MPHLRRAAALAAALTTLSLTSSVPTQAAPKEAPSMVGTFERLARDLVMPDGTMRDVYTDYLRTGDRTYKLRLPKGTHVHGGTPVRVRGRLSGQDLEATEVEQLGAPSKTTASGTTKVLMILAEWPGKPADSVTQAQAHAQIFSDGDGWFEEASYGQLGLTGSTTPWVQIPAPPSDDCYSHHETIMANAQAAAKAANAAHDAALFDRTIVYFPRCYGGHAAGAAGWAYEPGTTAWLNGFMDRRVSIHEQGHNYNLAHAHTYECEVDDVAVTLGGSCWNNDYGDDYDAMGGSSYSAHFSAPHKDQLGWLGGRKITLTESSQTFTLPPYETDSATPVAAVINTPVATRKYWVEYRQAIGYDSELPSGATDGVLLHMIDTTVAKGSFLLDPSPQDPFAEAVITSGGTWTSPEGVQISVGAVTASGATVTVTGNAPPPAVPGVPLNVEASAGDNAVRLSWSPPASNGGSSVTEYVLTRTAPGPLATATVPASMTSVTIGGLANGTAYTFTVAARNSVGAGPASSPQTATPTAQLPTVTVTAPAAGTVVTGPTTLTASPQPHAVSQAPIEYVEFLVGEESVGWADQAPWSVEWDPGDIAEGAHAVTAVAYDANGRAGTSPPVAVTVQTPRPAVSITSPADGASFTSDSVTLQAMATPFPGSDATIQYVQFELTDGTPLGSDWEAPYEWEWNVASITGPRTVVARAYDSDFRSGVSAPVTLTFSHPVPSVTFTKPAAGATVEGNAVTLGAAPVPSPVSGDAIDRVDFAVDGDYVGSAYEAPWEVSWDATSASGAQTLTATAYDTANHSASTTRQVFVVNNVPSAAVTAPVDGATTSGSEVAITATAAPNPVSQAPVDRVEIYVDGGLVDTVSEPGPYTATWQVSARYGAHTAVAKVYDTAGQSASSAPVSFSVPYPSPTAVVTSPAGGTTFRPGPVGIVAQAAPDLVSQSPIDRADFFVDGLWVGEDTDPSNGLMLAWDAPLGAHDLTVSVTDEDGWSGTSPPVSVTVADPPAVPAAVTATAGLDGTATVSWTAPATDGGSPVTTYLVRTGTTVKEAAASPFTFTGLANGATYSFSVAARNAAGDSAFSAASNVVKPGTATTVAITAVTTPVNHGSVTTVTGTLKKGATGIVGKTVQLVTCPNNSTTCTVVGSGVTGTNGVVKVATYKPPAHKYLRLRFLQSNELLPSLSAQKLVQVKAVVTGAINKTSMALGGTATVTGSVKPAHSGQRVYLQRYHGSSIGWRDTGLYRTQTTTGAVPGFAVKPTARGTYVYRLSFRGDADHLAGVSPNLTVKVT